MIRALDPGSNSATRADPMLITQAIAAGNTDTNQ